MLDLEKTAPSFRIQILVILSGLSAGSIFGVAVVLIFDNSVYSIHFSSKWERKLGGLFKNFCAIKFSNLIDFFSTLA